MSDQADTQDPTSPVATPPGVPASAAATIPPASATPAAAASRRGRVRLDRLVHVRRQLGAVYRDLVAWNPPDLKASEKIARARCLGLLLGQVAEVVRHGDLEARLAALEDALRSVGPRH